MNECLTTPQHKKKSGIGCQTNGIYMKSKKKMYKLKVHQVIYSVKSCAKFITNIEIKKLTFKYNKMSVGWI